MSELDKIENLLVSLSLTYEKIDNQTWLIDDREKGIENILIILETPIVIIRAQVTGIPPNNTETLFEELLRLNQSDLMHGAYALDGNDIILINTLVIQTLDQEELQATLDSISLAIVEHYEKLTKFFN